MVHEITKTVISVICLVTASITDVRTRRIPNKLTKPLLVLALVITAIYEPRSLPISLVVAGGFMLLGCVGGMGMGDTKLLMGLSILNGWKSATLTFVVALISLVVYFALFHFKTALQEAKNVVCKIFSHVPKQAHASSLSAPLAPFLAFGYVISILCLKEVFV